MTTPALTAKQAKFVAEFLVDANGTQAAIRAGYSVHGARVAAYRLLTNEAVYGAIEARQQADATRLAITRENVLQGLLEAFELAKADRQPAAMVSAARELGKLLGFYEPTRLRVDLGTDGQDQMARFEAMRDADLLKVMGAATDTKA